MQSRAVSELLSSLINVSLVLLLSLFVFIYAYTNFSNEYTKFNSILEGFNSMSKNDLIIEHAQVLKEYLILLLGNFGMKNLYLNYLELNSSIHINLNISLNKGENKLFKFYLGSFSFDKRMNITVFYTEEGSSRILNITSPLV